jgi:hypothetical protein
MIKSEYNMAESYPHLSQALGGEDGFDPMNPSVQKSMGSLLRESNCLLSTTYQLDVSGISNNKLSYIRVPRTQSNLVLFSTQKNGSTPSSKSSDQNTVACLNLPTT